MVSDRRFEEVRSRSMRHDVLRQLRNAILDGTLKPGERLNESKIAKEMGISRGPVREALLTLEQEGLVKSVHWRGAYVAELDLDSYRELIELRLLLETHAAKVATKRCRPEDYVELEGIIEQMRAACRAGDIEQVVEHDLNFHRTICRLSGNRLLLAMWEQMSARLRLAILLSIQHGYDAFGMVETHPPVLEAMKAGDAELAAQRLNDRTWEAAELIIAKLSQRKPAETKS